MGWIELIIIGSTACAAATLTFFSGFGLGTLLMPVLAVFFPVELAIMMTALVHVINNLAKLLIIGRYAVVGVVFRFGVPAMFAALIGAWVLGWLSGLPPIFHYQIFGTDFEVSAVKVVIAGLLMGFVVLEISGGKGRMKTQDSSLVIGGLLSGFFGGLSGHQGAFRSAYLLRFGFTPEQFLGTNVVIACLVDVARLSLYGMMGSGENWREMPTVLLGVVGAALLGTLIASRFLKKVSMPAIRTSIAVLLVGIAVGLGIGLL